MLTYDSIQRPIKSFERNAVRTGEYNQDSLCNFVVMGTSNRLEEIADFLMEHNAPDWMVDTLQGYDPITFAPEHRIDPDTKQIIRKQSKEVDYVATHQRSA